MTHSGFPVTLDGETFTEAEFTANGGTAYKDRLPQMMNAGAADMAAKQAAAAISAAAGTSTSTTSLTIGTGAKTLAVQTGKAYVPGMWLTVAGTADATNRMSGICTAYTSGTGSLTVQVEVIAGAGTIADWTVTIAIPVAGMGKQTAWVPAGALTPRTTNGPAIGSVELATNKVMVATLDFDAATVEYAQFVVAMPNGWDEAALTFRFVWSHAATTTNFGVVWAVRALATGDDDAMDAAFGTAVTVTDTGGTTNDQYTSAETAALTAAGSPAAHDLLRFEVYRAATDGSDTLAIDARLEGVVVYYTTNALSDA